MRRNPWATIEGEILKRADRRSLTVERLSLPEDGSGGNAAGAPDPVTGLWRPYGQFGITPFSDFTFSGRVTNWIFNPRSIAGLLLDLDPSRTNWQDTAQTIPSDTDGEVVGRAPDYSINNSTQYGLQATGANRPILRTGVNGLGSFQRNAWEFDGVNDSLGIVTADATNYAALTIALVFKFRTSPPAEAQYPIVLGGAVDGNGLKTGFEARPTDGGAVQDDTCDLFSGSGNDARMVLAGMASVDTPRVWVGAVNGNVHDAYLRSAQVSAAKTNLGSNQALTVKLGTADGLGIGGIGGSPLLGLFSKVLIGRVLVYSGMKTSAEVRAIEYGLSQYFGLANPEDEFLDFSDYLNDSQYIPLFF